MSGARPNRSDSATAATAATCAVCGRAEADPRLLARCYGCGRSFHLNPYAAAGTDCGDVWAGSAPGLEFTGLELHCAPCFAQRRAEAERALGIDPTAPPAEARARSIAALLGVPFEGGGGSTDGATGVGEGGVRATPSAEAPPRRTPRPRWRRRYRRQGA